MSGAFAAIGAGAGLLGARTGSQASADARATAGTVPETPASVSPSGLAVLHAGLAARLTAPCRIAFAGSSTTAGTGATSPDRRYVSVLVAALQRLAGRQTLQQENRVLGRLSTSMERAVDQRPRR